MVDTFSEAPEAWEEVREIRGSVGSPAAGALRTSRYNQGDIRSFALSWSVAPAGVKEAIETLHANTFGGALTMKWTPPGESDEIRVRFLPGTAGYTRSRTSAGVYAIGVGLVEAPEYRTPSQIT